MFAGNTGLTLAQGPWIEGFSSWILGFQALGFRARLGFKVFGARLMSILILDVSERLLHKELYLYYKGVHKALIPKLYLNLNPNTKP